MSYEFRVKIAFQKKEKALTYKWKRAFPAHRTFCNDSTETFLFCIMENISEKKTFYFIPLHTQNQQTICEESIDAKKKKKKKKTILTIYVIVHCIIVLC